MIQPPALIPASLLAPTGEAAPALNGDAVQGADFGALLAISVTPAVALGEPAVPAPTVALAAAALAPVPAAPATSGSILPLALPPAPSPVPVDAGQSALQLQQTAQAAAEPDETKTSAKSSAAVLESAPAAKPKAQRVTDKLTASGPRRLATSAAHKVDDSVTAEPDQTAAPVAVLPDALVAQVLAEPVATQNQPLSAISPSLQFAPLQPSPAASDGAAPPIEGGNQSAPQQPAPQQPAQAAFEHAAPQAAFLRALAPPAAPQPVPEQPAASEPSAPNRPLRIEIALPPQLASAARTASPVALRQRALAERETISAPLFAAATPAPQTPLQTAPQPASLARPQDFTALLDRLVAARDAAAPQRVSVTLPHAEFGPVHLRFRQEDGALAVTMTSADPDFARAAALAPAPVLPASESRTAPGSASHPDNSANTSSGQPRGQSSERRADHTSRDNPSPRATGQAKPDRRHGIFA